MADYQRRKREEEEGRAGKGKEGDSQEFFAGGSEHRLPLNAQST